MSKRSSIVTGMLLGIAVAAGAVLWSIDGELWSRSRPVPDVGVPTTGEEPPPQAPVEFRVLRTVPLDDAIPLLQLLQQDSPAVAVRLDLADIYRSAGFYGAAAFFENSAGLAQGEALKLAPVESPIAWSANADMLSERPGKVAREVSELVGAGRYGPAVNKAQADIEEHGPSLQVVVEWADAVLWRAIEDRDAVSAEALEIGLRIVLTSVDEKVYRPRGFISRAGGYKRISDVFLTLGDPTSGLTAAILAIATSKPNSPTEGLGDFTRRQLCDRIATIERELGLPVDSSRARLCGP